MHSTAKLLISPIPGAVVTGFLWFVINMMTEAKGVGVLDKQPWPVSDIYTCVAIGALLSFSVALLRWFRQRQRSSSLEAMCGMLGLKYSAEAKKGDFGGFKRLSVFDDWYRGLDRMSGEFRDLPVEMFDYTSRTVSRSSENTSTSFHSQTVVLLPAEPAWPAFELRPRGMLTSLISAAGIQGVQFELDDEMMARPEEREIVNRFNRSYFLSAGISTIVKRWAGEETAQPDHNPPPLADQFTLDTLRMLGKHPGWMIESRDGHVAFWRANRIIPPSRRRAFLSQAIDLFETLSKPERTSADERLQVTQQAVSRTAIAGPFGGMAVGGCAGMFLAVAICFPLIAWAFANDFPGWIVFIWPIAGMMFMIGGAFAGLKIAARLTKK